MNYNYRGSLAERFIRFRSGVLVTQDNSTDLFNAFSIYVPSELVTGNVKGVSGVTADQPWVKEVTLDNYLDVLDGELLHQWRPIFRDDTNFDVILYVIVFHVDDVDYGSNLEVDAFTIDYAPLTTAFEKLYALSFWKTLFFPRYMGDTPTPPSTGTTPYSEAKLFDLYLALSQLCLNYQELSYCLLFVRQVLPLNSPDSNPCQILSLDAAVEIAQATALDVATPNARSIYFWGMLHLIEAVNTWVITHSEDVNLIPEIFASYMASPNDTGMFIGNRLAKIRLSGTRIKPMGTPSWLNALANENMDRELAERLDEKNASYLISIADGTLNDSILLRAKGVTGFPVLATAMSKWVDYTTSQAIAKMMTSRDTLGQPVLRNEQAYERIKSMLLNNLQIFSRIGRLVNINLNFPAFSTLPESQTDITVTQGWTATYIDDLEKVQVSGTVIV